MATTRILAIDIGGSGGKAFVGTFKDGSFTMEEIHRFAHEGVSFYTPDRDGTVVERTYWDDTEIYKNIVEALHIYRRDTSEKLDSIAVDIWGADFQLMGPDGENLGKTYAYRDHRLDTMVDAVKSRMDPERIYELTGIHFQFFNLSGQLRWLVENRKHLLTDGAHILPVSSLFTWYLSGERAVDSTWASVTQLVEAETGAWSTEILDALEIPASLLPPIVPAGSTIGTLTPELAKAVRLNQANVVAVGAHDTACAFAAAPVDDPGKSLIISSGTWSLVGKLIPRPITSPEAMKHNLSNEGGIGNTRFLKNVMGFWIIQELRRIWRIEDGEEASWAKLDAETLAAPACGSLIDPDDTSFANPSNMQEAIDAFCERTQQARPETRGAYLRLVYESLALKYRLVNEQICEVSGTQSELVNIVGGGSKADMLNQFTADCLGLPVVAGPDEATATGNIMTQALALGLIKDLSEAQPIIRATFPISDYEPQDHARWDEPYARFKTLVS